MKEEGRFIIREPEIFGKIDLVIWSGSVCTQFYGLSRNEGADLQHKFVLLCPVQFFLANHQVNEEKEQDQRQE